MSQLILNKKSKAFLGEVRYYTFASTTCNGPMNFSIFLPQRSFQERCPVLFWLSGITCTEENFMVKSGVQRVADSLGMIIVCSDTSPREAKISGEGDTWDLGLGAGFYVDATEQPWSRNYRMYSFVTEELPRVVDKNFNTQPSQRGIFGHSMGGHGAIMIGLRRPDLFRSISAFSPICSLVQGPLGKKALNAYLGSDEEHYKVYDSTHLMRNSVEKTPILVYQGDQDHLLHSDLMPELLLAASKQNDYPLSFQMKSGYDHSYFFVATFIEDHLHYHASQLHH